VGRDGDLHAAARVPVDDLPSSPAWPVVPEASEVSFDRDRGRYRARVGDDKPSEDTLELPEDLHNGITGTLLKNLAPGSSAEGHMLAFAPKPHRRDTTPRAEGQDKFFVGDLAHSATRYLLKLELPGVKGVVVSILGKDPPDVRFWISTGAAPGFVKFEGPMFLKGPRWRVERAPPRWPER
jgi:hypothetical protein